MKTTPAILLVLALGAAGCSHGPTTAKSSEPKVKATSRTEAMLASLTSRLQRHPDDVTVMNKLALCYVQRGRETGELTNYVRARETITKATQTAPQDPVSLMNRAMVSTIFHDFQSALKDTSAALKIDPYLADAHGIAADSYMELGRYAEAMTATQKMMDMKPNLSSYARASQVKWLQGDRRTAAFFLLKAIDAGGTLENSAWCHVQLGDLYVKQGAYSAADSEYQKVLGAYPTYRHALAGMARVRVAEGKTAEGVALMEKAAEVDPSAGLLLELGELYRATGDNTKALSTLARIEPTVEHHMAIGIGGDEPMLARFYLKNGTKLDRALWLMREEAKEHTSATVYATLAWAESANGHKAEALAAAEKALKVGVKEPWIIKACSAVLAHAGEQRRADQLALELEAVAPNQTLRSLL